MRKPGSWSPLSGLARVPPAVAGSAIDAAPGRTGARGGGGGGRSISARSPPTWSQTRRGCAAPSTAGWSWRSPGPGTGPATVTASRTRWRGWGCTARAALRELMRLAWRSVTAIAARVVCDGKARADPLGRLRRIGVDESSQEKGHEYSSVGQRSRQRAEALGGGWPGPGDPATLLRRARALRLGEAHRGVRGWCRADRRGGQVPLPERQADHGCVPRAPVGDRRLGRAPT